MANVNIKNFGKIIFRTFDTDHNGYIDFKAFDKSIFE